jgi:hypothetical protein
MGCDPQTLEMAVGGLGVSRRRRTINSALWIRWKDKREVSGVSQDDKNVLGGRGGRKKAKK